MVRRIAPRPVFIAEIGVGDVIGLDVRIDIERVLTRMKSNRTDQLPFAIASALTATAQKIKEAEIEEMGDVFDRPTPFTLNSLYVSPATKRNLVASAYFKDFAPKGTAAGKYLKPQIEGGARSLKRMERALQSKGLMPTGTFAVPGAQAPLDAYGNVPGPFIVRMLSDLQAFGEQGYTANRKGERTGLRRTNYFFVPRKGSHLKPGVYWHMPNKTLGVVFVFVSKVSYSRRFNFYALGRRVQKAEFEKQFAKAWARALATAR